MAEWGRRNHMHKSCLCMIPLISSKEYSRSNATGYYHIKISLKGDEGEELRNETSINKNLCAARA